MRLGGYSSSVSTTERVCHVSPWRSPASSWEMTLGLFPFKMFELIPANNLISRYLQYKVKDMENILKIYWTEISEDARRQFIDANSAFTAWEAARKAATEVKGGMFWKHQDGGEYLIRTALDNSQKSLGARSEKTMAIYENFKARKEQAEQRVSELAAVLERHRRMNRALLVGRAPVILIEILNRLYKTGLAEHFTVVGTHALYAYEATAGVRFREAALATQDVDLLWDTRKRLIFLTQMETLGTSMLELIRKVDKTFEIRDDQKYTAVNSQGFEIDIIRREAVEGDPHPLKMTDAEDEFYAVQARKAGILLAGPRFSSVVVATNGAMARMNTISPLAFSKFKRWMAGLSDRDPLKRERDLLQAELVEALVEEYLPHLTV